MNNKIIVFDALDTIQGYKGAQLGESKRFYQERIADAIGMKVEELLQKVPYAEQLLLCYFEQQKGNLESVILPGAEEVISYVKSQGIKPVVVTADIPESALNTMCPFTDSGLIDSADVYAMNHLGSKKNPVTWDKTKNAYFRTGEIKSVFEDTEANLEAALKSYKTDGYLVKHQDNGLTIISKQVVRGNLYTLLEELEKRSQSQK